MKKSISHFYNQVVEHLKNDYGKTPEEVQNALNLYKHELYSVFNDDGEVILHDDPAKWAEIFAVKFGWLPKRKLTFL